MPSPGSCVGHLCKYLISVGGGGKGFAPVPQLRQLWKSVMVPDFQVGLSEASVDSRSLTASSCLFSSSMLFPREHDQQNLCIPASGTWPKKLLITFPFSVISHIINSSFDTLILALSILTFFFFHGTNLFWHCLLLTGTPSLSHLMIPFYLSNC